jgi:ankyrin repeat protein
MPTNSNSFELAADAIVGGELETLARLLLKEPALIRDRSMLQHKATLLHYVSANGVEDFRQKTPANIVPIADLLLQSGADVNATAPMYGKECDTLSLTATSGHPERAGVQEALMSKLLDYGARIDTPFLVASCLANGRQKAANFLAGKGATLNFAEAAGLGRLDLLAKMDVPGDSTLLQDGFLYACQYGHNPVIEFLIAKGVALTAKDRNGQTGLHWAVIGGNLQTVKLLLRHNLPLNLKNGYGGTVLGQALWSADHSSTPDSYQPIIEALVTAGARL